MSNDSIVVFRDGVLGIGLEDVIDARDQAAGFRNEAEAFRDAGAASAAAAAASALDAALYDGPTLRTAIEADTALTYGAGVGHVDVGDMVATTQGWFEVLASGATVFARETAGGVRLWPVALPEGASLEAFGVSSANTAEENALAIDRALASGFSRLVANGEYETTGGHLFHGVHLTGGAMEALRLVHVNGPTLAATYSQTGTTLTVTYAAHGLKLGQSVHLDFISGTAADGVYTVASMPTANTFTVMAASGTTSGDVTVDPGFVCAKAFVTAVDDSVTGTGLSDLTIVGARSGGTGEAWMTQCYSHVRVDNVQIEGYPAGHGLVLENYNGKWTESGVYTRLRLPDCLSGIRLRQNIGAAGTLSFGYNRIEGTISASPTGAQNFTIDAGCSLYGADVDLNIYMAADAAARGVNIEGFNHSRVRLSGEKPGGGSHTAFRIASTGQMRETGIHAVFENGAVSIDAAAVTVNSRGLIASTGASVWTVLDTKPAVSCRMSANFTLPTAAWTKPTSWTEDSERPSGVNNTAAGTFTAPIAGVYQVSCAACFTPAVGDRIAVRIATTSRNFVLAQDVATTTDDRIIGGSHIVSLAAGETVEMQIYTSNAGGDTIRASDADGSKTTFGVTYLAS